MDYAFRPTSDTSIYRVIANLGILNIQYTWDRIRISTSVQIAKSFIFNFQRGWVTDESITCPHVLMPRLSGKNRRPVVVCCRRTSFSSLQVFSIDIWRGWELVSVIFNRHRYQKPPMRRLWEKCCTGCITLGLPSFIKSTPKSPIDTAKVSQPGYPAAQAMAARISHIAMVSKQDIRDLNRNIPPVLVTRCPTTQYML